MCQDTRVCVILGRVRPGSLFKGACRRFSEGFMTQIAAYKRYSSLSRWDCFNFNFRFSFSNCSFSFSDSRL